MSDHHFHYSNWKKRKNTIRRIADPPNNNPLNPRVQSEKIAQTEGWIGRRTLLLERPRLRNEIDHNPIEVEKKVTVLAEGHNKNSTHLLNLVLWWLGHYWKWAVPSILPQDNSHLIRITTDLHFGQFHTYPCFVRLPEQGGGGSRYTNDIHMCSKLALGQPWFRFWLFLAVPIKSRAKNGSWTLEYSIGRKATSITLPCISYQWPIGMNLQLPFISWHYSFRGAHHG